MAQSGLAILINIHIGLSAYPTGHNGGVGGGIRRPNRVNGGAQDSLCNGIVI